MAKEKDHRIRLNQAEVNILVEALDLLWEREGRKPGDYFSKRRGIPHLRNRLRNPGDNRVRRGYNGY